MTDYCEQCGKDVAVKEVGSGPGFYGSMSWVTYECGHSDVDEAGPTP